MVLICCGKCGIEFSLPDRYEQELRRTHNTFWCPNGHQRHFPAESDAERYKRLYEEAEAKALSNREKLAALERASVRREKEFARHKKRAAAGVCPCCQRTVAQLAKHMQSKHKDYVALQGVPTPKQLTDGSKPN